MMLDAPNPTQVQFTPSSKRASPPTPLVLIHDGGGTTFSYFMLGNLRREVWAIYNPRQWNDSLGPEIIDEMASHYVSLIHEAGIRGPIVVGGWSFGGYLALAVARLTAGNTSSKITVTGILIIDSPFPVLPLNEKPEATELDSGELSALLLTHWPESVRKSFEDCALMLETWQPPAWDGPVAAGNLLNTEIAGRSWILETEDVLYKPVGKTWEVIKSRSDEQPTSGGHLITPPPAVMIRCTQTTPGVFDSYRGEILLGWEGNYPNFIKAVIDVDAEHFTLFDTGDRAKTKHLTAQVNDALAILSSFQEIAE